MPIWHTSTRRRGQPSGQQKVPKKSVHAVRARPLWPIFTLRTVAPFQETEPLRTCAEAVREWKPRKPGISRRRRRRARAAQRLGAHRRRSATMPEHGDRKMHESLEEAAARESRHMLRKLSRRYRCSRRCRVHKKRATRCARVARARSRASFLFCGCCARCHCLGSWFFFSCCVQAYSLR